MTGKFELDRPPRDWVLMNSAHLWARRGTCSRAQVGCVISRNGRNLVSGYNGAPAGMDHCDHRCICMPVSEGNDLPKRWVEDRLCTAHEPCVNAVHAEANALAFAAKYGVGIEGAELHTTRVPCLTCAGLIINAGIIRVVWFEEHREMDGYERLGLAGLEVVRYQHA